MKKFFQIHQSKGVNQFTLDLILELSVNYKLDYTEGVDTSNNSQMK